MPKLLENDQPTSSARWLARNETNSERRFRPTTQKKSTQNINNTESSASKAHTNQASKPKTLQPNYSDPAAELPHQS